MSDQVPNETPHVYATTDEVTAEIGTHAALEGTSAHGATAAATASKIVARDGSGNINAAGLDLTGALTTTSTIDGRDVATDGSKLDGVEALADVTDATNVAAAGAVMDSDFTAADRCLSDRARAQKRRGILALQVQATS